MAMLTRLCSFVAVSTLRSIYLLVAVSFGIVQLAEAGNSNGSRDNNGRDNNQNYNEESSQSSSSKAGFFTRMDADVGDMWLTPPSAWSNEYWQVFGGIVLMGLVSIAMVVFLCFAPICCCREAHHAPSKVKIKSKGNIGHDWQKQVNVPASGINTSLNAATRNEKNNPIYSIPEGEQQWTGSSDPAIAKQHASGVVEQANDSSCPNNYASGPITIGVLENGKNGSQTADVRSTSSANAMSKCKDDKSSLAREDHPNKERTKYRRTSLWSEVLSVWSEFLQHGFNVPVEAGVDQSQQSHYKPLQDEDVRSRRTTSREEASVSCSGGTTTPRRIKIKHKRTTSPSMKQVQKPFENAESIEHDNNRLEQITQGEIV